MNGWGPAREVEKIPTTQRERHAMLKADALTLTAQLDRYIDGLELLHGRDNPSRWMLIKSKTLIGLLVAELRVPK